MPSYKRFYCESSSSSDDCCWPFFPFLFNNNQGNQQFPTISVNLGGNPINIPLFLLPGSCAESILELAIIAGLTGGNANNNNLLLLLPLICGGCRSGKCKKHKRFWNSCWPGWGNNNWWWWNWYCNNDSSSSSSCDSSSSSSSCGCLYIENSSSSSSCWDYKKSPLYCRMKKKNGRRRLKCRRVGRPYHNGHNGHDNKNAGEKKELVL